MTKERSFIKSYASELISIAGNDLKAARTLAQDAKVRRETVFFLLQQTVEKSLKALLVSKSEPVPLVHDIGLLLDRLRDEPTVCFDGLEYLSDFASIRRYEEGIFIITDEELQRFLDTVHICFKECEKIIGKNLDKKK